MEASLSDSFLMEGMFQAHIADTFSPDATEREQTCCSLPFYSLCRGAALFSVLLRRWGWGPVSILRLLATAVLTLQSVVWCLQFSQITDKDEVTSHPAAVRLQQETSRGSWVILWDGPFFSQLVELSYQIHAVSYFFFFFLNVYFLYLLYLNIFKLNRLLY